MAALTDPIADMLTRIRNAILAGHYRLNLPASQIKTHIAEILHQEGFIDGYEYQADDLQGRLEIVLRYTNSGENAIQGLQRVSRPGRRVYTGFRDLPKIRNGLGVAILSTSQGVLSDKIARERRIGGEILCHVW